VFSIGPTAAMQGESGHPRALPDQVRHTIVVLRSAESDPINASNKTSNKTSNTKIDPCS
jgi:hypothetical protein